MSRLFVLIGVLAGLSLHTSAIAQPASIGSGSAAPAAAPQWTFDIGPGVVVAPWFEGGANYRVLPIPSLDLRYQRATYALLVGSDRDARERACTELLEAARAAGTGVGVKIMSDQSCWPSHPTPGVNRGYDAKQLRADGTLATCTATCGEIGRAHV